MYYPVRQHLVQHMVSSIQRLGLTPNATIEQRKLVVDLAEVVIKWEFQRVSIWQRERERENVYNYNDTGYSYVDACILEEFRVLHIP